MTKRLKLDASLIQPLAEGRGSCIASDDITVRGNGVGYMYREMPDTTVDSGWRFFSGYESQEFADDPNNFELYDVNTIANYDPSIIPFLDEAPGSAWGRDIAGQFVREPMPVDPDA